MCPSSRTRQRPHCETLLHDASIIRSRAFVSYGSFAGHDNSRSEISRPVDLHHLASEERGLSLHRLPMLPDWMKWSNEKIIYFPPPLSPTLGGFHLGMTLCDEQEFREFVRESARARAPVGIVSHTVSCRSPGPTAFVLLSPPDLHCICVGLVG